MRISKLWMGLAAATLFASGCADQEDPAQQAVASTEAALNEVRVAAAQFAPLELKSADVHLNKLRTKLAQQEYKHVLADAPELNAELRALEDITVSRQTQIVAASHEWESLSTEVPRLVDAIQTRVDSLSQSPTLPNDVNQQAFEAAKNELESMKSLWAEASSAFSAGKTMEATDKARTVQAKGEKVIEQLAMSAA